MSVKDQYRLRHMLDAAIEIGSFVQGREKTDLWTDRKLALSLVALYQILGEASKNVSSQFRSEHPEVEWSAVARMRDRIAHGYFDIDFEVIWDASQDRIPGLIAQLEALLDQQGLDL
jgi:uncharacterized protein with HEPN domain